MTKQMAHLLSRWVNQTGMIDRGHRQYGQGVTKYIREAIKCYYGV